jgi:hypothetical protein
VLAPPRQRLSSQEQSRSMGTLCQFLACRPYENCYSRTLCPRRLACHMSFLSLLFTSSACPTALGAELVFLPFLFEHLPEPAQSVFRCRPAVDGGDNIPIAQTDSNIGEFSKTCSTVNTLKSGPAATNEPPLMSASKHFEGKKSRIRRSLAPVYASPSPSRH